MTEADSANTDSVRYATGSGGQSPDAGLARDLSELAREMQAETTVEALLERITAAAVYEVDGAEHAGISEADGKHVHTRASTHELVTTIDDLQYRIEDGPCLTSLREQVTVRSDDLAAEDRWPRFAPAASGAGVRSMLSVQLFVDGDNLGVLNLYNTKPNAFDETSENAAMLLAAHAAVAWKGARVEGNLRTALETRDVIGQAKGILMERFKIDAAAAFDLLILASQRTNIKVRDVADQLATTGELRVK